MRDNQIREERRDEHPRQRGVASVAAIAKYGREHEQREGAKENFRVERIGAKTGGVIEKVAHFDERKVVVPLRCAVFKVAESAAFLVEIDRRAIKDRWQERGAASQSAQQSRGERVVFGLNADHEDDEHQHVSERAPEEVGVRAEDREAGGDRVESPRFCAEILAAAEEARKDEELDG